MYRYLGFSCRRLSLKVRKTVIQGNKEYKGERGEREGVEENKRTDWQKRHFRSIIMCLQSLDNMSMKSCLSSHAGL